MRYSSLPDWFPLSINCRKHLPEHSTQTILYIQQTLKTGASQYNHCCTFLLSCRPHFIFFLKLFEEAVLRDMDFVREEEISPVTIVLPQWQWCLTLSRFPVVSHKMRLSQGTIKLEHQDLKIFVMPRCYSAKRDRAKPTANQIILY